MSAARDPDDPHHYPAELYELVHRGTPGDLAFYRRSCGGARSVLELGCGYGRVVEAIAGPGLDVVGLEHDPELLARARTRCARFAPHIDFHRGDMREFALDRLFDRVLIPHSGLYCLASEDDCLSCLRAALRHLAPGGLLIADAYVADGFHDSAAPREHTDERLDPVVAVEHEGRGYAVFERSRWHREGQRLDVTYEYVPREGGPALQGALGHRYWLTSQIAPLFERAGLEVVSIAGDWEGGDLDPEGEFWVATATARGER